LARVSVFLAIMFGGLRLVALVAGAAALGGATAHAAPCTNPYALGVSRVLTVDARAMPLIGSHDYGFTLPLAPGEVVLTFDDGPVAPYTNQVLKALAHECVQATFFMVGRQARANPELAWQVRAAGHTIGTHTENHLLFRMPADRAAYEIDTGIASVGKVFRSQRMLAPFFRFPGLFRSNEGEQHLRRRGLMAWSVDVDSYDWKKIGVSHMLGHTLHDLEKRRGGILLMHDVQAKTAMALPTLLAELKSRRYRIVHVIPSGGSATPEIVAGPPPQTEGEPQLHTQTQPQIQAQPQFPVSAPAMRERDERYARTVPQSPAVSPYAAPVQSAPRAYNPGGGGLFEAIFSSSVPR
jgi:peptidoglycan/xylan/chitin deacetylase (PgdA/CDA1 family)